MEHPLVPPLVTKLFEQSRNKSGDGIRGVNARVGVLCLEGLDDWRRVLHGLVIRPDHQGNDGDLGVLLIIRHGVRIAYDPAVGEALVAVIGAYLHRVG
jgi:hypothetical protein